MKKLLMGIGVMSVLLSGAHAALAADKVVIVPLGGSKAAAFENVSHRYNISGTTFQASRKYGQFEGNGWEVSGIEPFMFSVMGQIPYGRAHNKDGGDMSFVASVHLPDGASLGHVGAAVCSEDETLTDHNIGLNLMKTDMVNGSQSTIRSYTIESTACNVVQGGDGMMVMDIVNNDRYVYEFRVENVEGGECFYVPPTPPIVIGYYDCDDRRVRLQYATIEYTTNDIVK